MEKMLYVFPNPRIECKLTSRRINFNAGKTACCAPKTDNVCGDIVCACMACSLIICPVNLVLTRAASPPPPTLFLLSIIFHNMVSVVIAVVYASRSRTLLNTYHFLRSVACCKYQFYEKRKSNAISRKPFPKPLRASRTTFALKSVVNLLRFSIGDSFHLDCHYSTILV